MLRLNIRVLAVASRQSAFSLARCDAVSLQTAAAPAPTAAEHGSAVLLLARQYSSNENNSKSRESSHHALHPKLRFLPFMASQQEALQAAKAYHSQNLLLAQAPRGFEAVKEAFVPFWVGNVSVQVQLL